MEVTRQLVAEGGVSPVQALARQLARAYAGPLDLPGERARIYGLLQEAFAIYPAPEAPGLVDPR